MNAELSVIAMHGAEVDALRRGNAELLAALREAVMHMPSGRARADAMQAIRKYSR